MEILTRIVVVLIFINALGRLFISSLGVIYAEHISDLFLIDYVNFVVGPLYILSAVGLWKYKKWGAYTFFGAYSVLVIYFISECISREYVPGIGMVLYIFIQPLIIVLVLRWDWHKFNKTKRKVASDYDITPG